jgi:hypothetical protein
MKKELAKLQADNEKLNEKLNLWIRCATRLAHAYRDNSITESTRAFVEYARLKAQEEDQ